MNCPTCNAENPDSNRFCGNCGSEMILTCPSCSSPNPPGNRFCGNCGAALGGEGAPAVSAADTPTSAERRLVSVLFADLVGFTPFSEGRDPEEVRALLTEYFDRARDVVDRFGGAVDKFIGDAVMAVWGATAANEDDAERAVRAGLELVDAVAKLASDAGLPELALRVGVLTGEASVGPGGNEKGLVVGDLVNTASRLQSIADPGTVFVGEATYQAVKDSVSFSAIGRQMVKGKELPVPTYRAQRVISERAGRGRVEGLEPPFVGRVDELRLLKDALSSVGRERRSRLISIIGQGGIGKSRVIWEFLKYIDGLAETFYWHEGRSPSYGDGVTFWALGEMVRSRAGIAETDDTATTQRKLNEMLDEWVPDPDERRWIGPRLASLLGTGDPPVEERPELFAAYRTFFERISNRGTAVLVFEDLHWADSGMLDFVEELPDWWRDRPILVITLARPELQERRSGWGAGAAGHVSMHLGQLAEADMHDLVGGMVPGISDDARTSIVDRAAGVPLYAVELVRMLLASGELSEIDGVYHATESISELPVPDSLQALIGARLDRLGSDDRTLLQDAAILGASFTIEGLAIITGHEEQDLESRLATLGKRELLERIRDPRSPERGQYRFVQSLIREVTLGRMNREARRERHVQVAEYMEELGDLELSPIVASHYLEAYRAAANDTEAEALRAKARKSLVSAVDRAAALHSYEQVMGLGNQALEAAGSDAERAPLWERTALAAESLTEFAEAEKLLNQAIDHYRVADDQHALNRATRKLGLLFVNSQTAIRAVDLLEPYLARFNDDLDADRELVRAGAVLARAYLLEARPIDAAAAAERVLPAAEKLGVDDVLVDALNTRGTALASVGRPRHGIALVKEAKVIAAEGGMGVGQIRACINLAYTSLPRDAVLAYQNVREAYELSKRFGRRDYEFFALGTIKFYEVDRGDLEAADAAVDESRLEEAPPFYQMHDSSRRSMTAAARGDMTSARQHLERGEQLGATMSDKQAHHWLHRSDAFIELIDGNLTEAFHRSMELAAGFGLTIVYDVPFAVASASLLGDPDRIHEAEGLIGNEIPRLRLQLSAMRLLLEDPDVGVTESDAALAELDRQELGLHAALFAAAVAHHVPTDHPDQARFAEDLKRRCDVQGLDGVWNLYESLA